MIRIKDVFCYGFKHCFPAQGYFWFGDPGVSIAWEEELFRFPGATERSAVDEGVHVCNSISAANLGIGNNVP